MTTSTKHRTTRSPRSAAKDSGSVAPALTLTVSPRLQHTIDDLRKPIQAYVSDAVTLVTTRSELAPRFMRAFDTFSTESGGKFVDFCRLFVPSIPADRSGYRADSSYQQLDYLRRLVAQQSRGEKKPLPASRRPATPYQALARLIATVLPQVDPNGALWHAFVHEMHWTEKTATRIKTLGAKLGPVPISGRATMFLRKTGTHG